MINYWYIGFLSIDMFRIISPSRGPAQPVGVPAEQSVHYFCDYSSFFFLCHILFCQKGLSYGFEILHEVLSHKIYRILDGGNSWGPPCTYDTFFTFCQCAHVRVGFPSTLHIYYWMRYTRWLSFNLPSSDTCAEKIPLNGGLSRGSSVGKPVSEVLSEFHRLVSDYF